MIVGVGCWRGSGATTTALLLAAALAEAGAAPWLIEADPAGGVLALRCGVAADELGGSQGVGIERLARPRPHDAAAEQFDRVALPLGAVRFVPAPADPFRAHACVTPRAAWVGALDSLDGPVVVDVGRLRPGATAWSLLDRLDLLLLATSAEAGAMVASDDWAATGGRIAGSDSGIVPEVVRLVVVDAPCAGARFERSAAESELEERLAGWIPWAPRAVELVHRGVGFDDRRVRRGGFAAAVRRSATQVAAACGEWSPVEEVGT